MFDGQDVDGRLLFTGSSSCRGKKRPYFWQYDAKIVSYCKIPSFQRHYGDIAMDLYGEIRSSLLTTFAIDVSTPVHDTSRIRGL